MGIIVDAVSIGAGALIGSIFKMRVSEKSLCIMGISIMIISLCGFLENIFGVSGKSIESVELFVVVFALIIGSLVGESLHIEEKMSNLSKSENKSFNAFTDSVLFFAVGGLQISGPILLGLENDNSQLILKSIIDFPFAILFGATYGVVVSVSALPVCLMQIAIASGSFLCGDFFTDAAINQLCSMGYIILFFSGFNLICEEKQKINNINMLPSIFLILIYNLISNFWR